MRSIKDVDVKNKRVFLRADFNVPIIDGKIADDNRIKAVLPTLNFLREKRAKIIIGTHAGRPDGKKTPESSILLMAKRLAKLINDEVIYIDDVIGKKVEEAVSRLEPGQVMVLGNLRWYPGEEENDAEYAQNLASYADIYVNDAFAVSHRSNASVDAITKLLPSYAGFLLESEVTTLQLLFEFPVKPLTVVIGGAKVKDKAGVINTLAEKADSVLLGGAVANTFLKARGDEVGDSLVDAEMLDECRAMLEKFGSKMVLPIDSSKDERGRIMDIGPETGKKYASLIKEANSIFINGNLGYTEDEKFAKGTATVIKAISESKCGIKVAAGGDTVGFINEHNLASGFSFLSTGGGAALEFLAGEKLPGIEALK